MDLRHSELIKKNITVYSTLLGLSKALLLIEPRGTFEHRRALMVRN